MATFSQLIIYTTGLFLVTVEADSNALLKLFKIGNGHSVLIREQRYEPQFQFGPDTVDRSLSVCFALVTAYIGYIIISFFIQPKLKRTTEDLSNNPGLKALLETHHFRDTGMPSKMRNLFDTSDHPSEHLSESSYVGSTGQYVPVHTTPTKHASKVLQM